MAMQFPANNVLYMVPTPAPTPVQQQHQPKPIRIEPSAATYSAPAKYGGTPTVIKPPKRLRKDDNQITRCKRRLDFAKLGLPVQRHNPVVAAKRNERERNRVRHINDTFVVLRDHLPADYNTVEKVNKEMSKVEILRAAIDYITTLEEMLAGKLQISGGLELKALIQASTSPDSKTPEKHKETIAKFFGRDFHMKEEPVASPAASVQSSEHALMSPMPAQNVSMTSLAATSEQTALGGMNGYSMASDFNDNDVKCSYAGLVNAQKMTQSAKQLPVHHALATTPQHQSKQFTAPQHTTPQSAQHTFQNNLIQHNHVTQSDQFTTLQQLDSLLANNNNFEQSSMKSQSGLGPVTPMTSQSGLGPVTPMTSQSGLGLVTPQQHPSWNSNDMILEKNLASLGGQYGQVPGMASPALSVASSSYDQQTMFDNIDLNDVDFTSLLMNI